MLARKRDELLVGEGLDREQIVKLREAISFDTAVETLGRLLTMQLGTESVLLTAAIRFRRSINLDEVDKAILRPETLIKLVSPSIFKSFVKLF